MKTLKKSVNGLFNGRLFLIRMLLSKPKKLHLIGKFKKTTHRPLFFNKAIVSQTNSPKHFGLTLD